MAINKFMKLALKALSYPDIDIRKTYQLQRSLQSLRAAPLDAQRWQDFDVCSGGLTVPVRIYRPAGEEKPAYGQCKTARADNRTREPGERGSAARN